MPAPKDPKKRVMWIQRQKEAKSGNKNPMYGKKGKDSPVYGRHRTPEEKEKVRIANTGRRASTKSINKQKESMAKFRKEHPEMGLNHSKRMKGENNPSWKGGITSLHKTIRRSMEYRLWKISVFERDKYTCQKCKTHGGYLEVHHIKQFIDIIEENNITTIEQALSCKELFDIDNGITYCEDCHDEEHFEKRI